MNEYGFKPPEPTPHYEGTAEVWVDGTKSFDAIVRLTGCIEATGITSFGGTQCLESVNSWDGRLVGTEQRDRFRLVGKSFELKLPNGRSGTAVLRPRAHTWFLGTGDPPFDFSVV
jgi:hypothetical protein